MWKQFLRKRTDKQLDLGISISISICLILKMLIYIIVVYAPNLLEYAIGSMIIICIGLFVLLTFCFEFKRRDAERWKSIEI